jgi:hypothetical protein
MGTAISQGVKLPSDVENSDGTPGNFEDFSLAGRNFVNGGDDILWHIYSNQQSAISNQQSAISNQLLAISFLSFIFS